jgi:two-component system CheB/CheR fusion protein
MDTSTPSSRVTHSNPLDPDTGEVELGTSIDDAVPTRGYSLPPLIALGGSAGSIQALQQFFAAMPADTGMVFVVVIHLSPDHESNLDKLLQRATTMPVVQVAEPTPIEVNHVYVIAPNRSLTVSEGWLNADELPTSHGKRVAVDILFRTMADSYGPHAIAVVLSGADGDGAIGVKRVKERGGLTVVQDPTEAEQPGMPRTALDTGMVDWILPVAVMRSRIVRFVEHEKQLRLPPEQPEPAAVAGIVEDELEAALRKVLAHLRTRTGHDFTTYKRATILRRIARRMQVNGVLAMPEYFDFLGTHPGETEALFHDLLISVTNFFRDSVAFEALERLIPELFANRDSSETIRVWVPACATGEEAYSIAMLLSEHAATLADPPMFQVFATDLDDRAIHVARAARYPATIEADVSPDRLRRFFNQDHGEFRIRRELRESVLFSLHDVLKDSPFSRLDLVSCRNLLIYLDERAKDRLLEIFRFALLPGGKLFLGISESIPADHQLFSSLDKRHRIYAARPTARTPLPSLGTAPSTIAMRARDKHASGPVLPTTDKKQQVFVPEMVGSEESQAPWTNAHARLLEQFGPPSILVNQLQEIVHISGNAGQFLHFASGEPSRDLLHAIHPDLRVELRALIYRAVSSGQAADSPAVPLGATGTPLTVTMTVTPVGAVLPDYLLVNFQVVSLDSGVVISAAAGSDEITRHLEREIERLKNQLRDLREENEASSEELKASNEELQAMNEELRSATEELETGREELQSVNEELTTVNTELKHNIEELGDANSDLHNLIGATALATIFLDRDLNITRFTPTAVGLFTLIRSDIGRPLTDLTHRLDYPALAHDAAEVLESLVPIEREVGEANGRWFLARWVPYRTLADNIAGVVLTLVDITARKQAEDRLVESRAELLVSLQETERARAAAEAATHAKDEFLAVLSHELRTPLNPVLLAAGVLQRIPELPPKAHDLVTIINRNVATEVHLIDDLLDVTRIAHGKLSLEMVELDAHQMISDAILVAESDIKARRQVLQVELTAESSTIMGDAARLQQAFWNLIKNAAKFTGAGERIVIKSIDDSGAILITVCDEGMGIDAETLPMIFEPFNQGRRQYGGQGGLGLGLAISRSIIEAHGGSIAVTSEGTGQGTTFSVRLPLKRQDSDA